jgi:hypothetical protein
MIDKTQERGQTDRQWSTKHKKGDKQTDNGRQNTRKGTNRQTMVDKTQHRKLKIEQHSQYLNLAQT